MNFVSRLRLAITVASGLAATAGVISIARGQQGTSRRKFREEESGQNLVPTHVARRIAATQTPEVKLRTTVRFLLQNSLFIEGGAHVLDSSRDYAR